MGAWGLGDRSQARNQHLLDVEQKCNEGPHWAVEETSESYTRPLVRQYNAANGHQKHVVTSFEESRVPFDEFERSKVLAADDGLKLGESVAASRKQDRGWFREGVNVSKGDAVCLRVCAFLLLVLEGGWGGFFLGGGFFTLGGGGGDGQ